MLARIERRVWNGWMEGMGFVVSLVQVALAALVSLLLLL
jgi:hypothetical protein